MKGMFSRAFARLVVLLAVFLFFGTTGAFAVALIWSILQVFVSWHHIDGDPVP